MKKIIFIFRVPVGGLFRHVYDVGIELAKRGYDIGIICSDDEVPPRWQNMLDELAGFATLGVLRTPIARGPNIHDILGMVPVIRFLKQAQPDIVHGHGAKGGLYARLCTTLAGVKAARIYTTHGGSLHFPLNSFQGRVFANIELFLLKLTDGIVFESVFIKKIYEQKVSVPKCAIRVVYNGLEPHEFIPIDRSKARYDFLFMAEFVYGKGYDLFVQAMAKLKQEGADFKALCAGSGAEEQAFKAMVEANGLADYVDFRAPMAARDLFAEAKILVLPSRAESMPYAILEAAAAQMPLISTKVGGIPEIIAQEKLGLFDVDDLDALAANMRQFLSTPMLYERAAKANRHYVLTHFQMNDMVYGLFKLYEVAAAKQ